MIEILISLLISLTILVVVLFGLLVYSKKEYGKKSEVTLNIYNHNGECVLSSKFESVEKTGDMVRIISKKASSISTRIVAASTKEEELDTRDKFFDYMK